MVSESAQVQTLFGRYAADGRIRGDPAFALAILVVPKSGKCALEFSSSGLVDCLATRESEPGRGEPSP